jgi:hypothetical protein
MVSTVAGVMVLLALLAQPGVASAAPVDVSGAFGGFRASAKWWLPPEGDGVTQTYAFAEVYQPATTTDGSGIAVIGIGNCVKSDAEEDGRICRGAGFPHELVAGELELSPTLDSALVDYAEAGGEYHVTWKATDALPTITPAHERGERTVAAGGKIFRNAVAGGTIRGLTFDQAIDRAADLSRGGAFGATFQPGGRVEVTFRLPPDVRSRRRPSSTPSTRSAWPRADARPQAVAAYLRRRPASARKSSGLVLP